MFGDITEIKIIKKDELKVGDMVLWHQHKVKVLDITFPFWTYENEEIGKMKMLLYDYYYKII